MTAPGQSVWRSLARAHHGSAIVPFSLMAQAPFGAALTDVANLLRKSVADPPGARLEYRRSGCLPDFRPDPGAPDVTSRCCCATGATNNESTAGADGIMAMPPQSRRRWTTAAGSATRSAGFVPSFSSARDQPVAGMSQTNTCWSGCEHNAELSRP